MRYSRLKIVASALISLATVAAFTPAANAAFTMTLTQSGGNVTAIGSGSLNITALTSPGNGTMKSEAWPADGLLAAGPTTVTNTMSLVGASGPASFGSGGQTFASSGSGNSVVVDGQFGGINVPLGYTSGSPLSDTATFAGATFASLGINPGTYVYTWGIGPTADSFTLTVTAVPEPASLSMLAMSSFLLLRRRARQHR